MKVFWFRQALQLLPGALAGLFAWAVFGAGMAAAQAQLTTEKVPTFLGMDLPLLPGERVIPTADPQCSVVAFAPGETRYNRFVSFWQNRTWTGACRFGLAHGKGYAVGVSDNSSLELNMLYGLEIAPPESFQTKYWSDGTAYRDKTHNHLAGTVFSDLGAVRYRWQSSEGSSRASTLADISGWWLLSSYLQKQSFDAAGNERVMTIVEVNVAAQCGNVQEPFKAFASEVKKACGVKIPEKHILVRREGLSSEPTDSHKIVWAKACKVPKNYSWAECAEHLPAAIGNDIAELNAILAGDAAARAAAEQEIMARYAPLEQAVEARVNTAGSGAQ
ncbi:hypothetical protein [Hyphomonas sp.]|uniref:hypothetical protein n=1 Tax=Hyphomonas sp. TaxID=87 RepID=UPI00391A7B5A